MATATLATRYRCSLQNNPQCWGDKSKRDKCNGCGARLHVLRGRWGVFTWRGDGRYNEDNAHRIYVRESAADAVVARDTTGTYVVRWISA